MEIQELPVNRPESWNARMPFASKPLITDNQFKRLLANSPKDPMERKRHDPVPVVKIFLPHVRWLLCWIYPENLNHAFGLRMWGREQPEAVHLSLLDLVASRLGMVRPERDLYITLDQPLSFYLQNPSCW